MDDKAARRSLGELLKGLGKDEAPATLVHLAEALFENAQAEEVERLGPRAMEWLARHVHDFISRRRAGHGKWEVFNPPARLASLKSVSVVQALNDDMPFLVDSLLAHMAEKGLEVRLLTHPVLRVERDAKGNLKYIERRSGGRRRTRPESLIHLHTRRLTAQERKELLAEIRAIHAQVRAAVLDWPAMRQRVERIADDWQGNPPPVTVEELTEFMAFLQWLLADHFVFLGACEYAIGADGRRKARKRLGILRAGNEDMPEEKAANGAVCMEEGEAAPILISKSVAVSRVHRRAPMDLVIIRLHDAAGDVRGELRLVGLFTSSAYVRAARDIPLVRRKIEEAMARSGLDGASHRGKALLNILETFPRDELFELDVATLTRVALGILSLSERPRPRVFVWRGCSTHYLSSFVYVPRERFNSDLRKRIGEILETMLGARVINFTPSFEEGTMVRVHYRLACLDDRRHAAFDVAATEAAVVEVVRSWEDRLREEMRAAWGEQRARRMEALYGGAFSQAWQEAWTPKQSLHDLETCERLDDETPLAVALSKAEGQGENLLRLKIYHLDSAVPLAERVPILANIGLEAIDERTFTLRRGDHTRARDIFIHEVMVRAARPIDIDELAGKLEEGFMAVWNGLADNDPFNALITNAGLDWRQVAVLRALARWLRQGAAPHGVSYIAATLNNHPRLARLLWDIFEALLKPGRMGARGRLKKAKEPRDEVLAGLADVSSLDEDRIIRLYLAALFALRRSNFWQRRQVEGAPAPLAFKFASQEADFLPPPRPWAEIFVHAPDVEGVHLRGGPVARGGIRWSDRPHDFRTEILGLMKAQTVKNAVIVPVGAKGGFVLRRPPRDGGRAAFMEAGKRAYRRFINALLDITDNISGDKVIAPERVARLDDDDPYLVVAADKGTATFSDMANEIAAGHGFWLGDAFASGGSAGYDHKKMGITARGAWEAVKRHFREMDMDIQKQPFDVIGVGDMSGDVFGNGMLLSRQIRLVAAFDHRDIFIDPDPDPAASFRERKRLFNKAGSSWQDYRREMLSPGGGVYSRRAKSISLSPQARRRLGIEAESLTPDELIRAMLRADADLLWLGGIGTYVRASSERDSDVGDPTNDALRVTASELKVKVVGEGANLGLTQKARIEFAMAGGRINTDAIDNSAGVNTSDMEVNMKIALAAAEKSGRLSRKRRNELLAEMEPEVARLVLRNNYLQTLRISLSQARAGEESGDMARLMQALEKRGALDRKLEVLPGDAEMKERRAHGRHLTRPEIAVLMSWAKIVLFDDLLECKVVDDPFFEGELTGYFPAHMRENFASEINCHRLRREIIANRLGNALINHGGPAFMTRMEEETGRTTAEIARAFTLAMTSFGLAAINDAIDRLDGRVKGTDQLHLYLLTQHALRRASAWFLRNLPLEGGLTEKAGQWRCDMERMDGLLGGVITSHARKRMRMLRAKFAGLGAPEELARRLARLPYLVNGLDIIAAARQAGAEPEETARIYFHIGHELGFSSLMMAARRLEVSGHLERLARERLMNRLAVNHRTLTAAMARGGGAEAVEEWRKRHAATVERAMRMLSGVSSGKPFNLSHLSLAVALFDELVEATREGA